MEASNALKDVHRLQKSKVVFEQYKIEIIVVAW
jgi:hypothetical protein